GRPRAAADILSRFAANDSADGCDMARLARCLADCGEWDAARGVIGTAGASADEDAAAEIAAAALHVALLSPATKTLPATVAAEAPLVEPDPSPLPERPRIGVLATALGGPGDIESVATLAQGLRETGASLVVFGAGPLTAPHNRLLQGRVGRHIDAAEFDAFTLAHTVMTEGVDLLLDAGGIAAPLHLATLAHHPAPRTAGWLNLPLDTGVAGLDRVLGAAPPASGIIGRLDASPRLLPADDVPLIGADIGAGAMHDDLLQALAAILRTVPDARLLLRDHELSHPDMVGTLIERFGALSIADRIEIVDTDHVTFIAGLDLLLHPFVAESGNDVVDATAHGTPAIALRGTSPWRRQGANALQALGLGSRVAATCDDYAAIGAGLLADRARARAETAAVTATAPAFAPAAFATGLLELFRA
ncbi:MAG: hypothetical protein PHS60_09245, partial [Zavarzinia sp.]|nr:hypothetical protein [Zavarzinia sp.]